LLIGYGRNIFTFAPTFESEAIDFTIISSSSNSQPPRPQCWQFSHKIDKWEACGQLTINDAAGVTGLYGHCGKLDTADPSIGWTGAA
jgi:hypothetical protein